SDVSVDSDGFPKMLESPPKQEVPQKAAPTRIFKKAIGNPEPIAYLPNLKGPWAGSRTSQPLQL
ncbi:MAG: hypothetical protein NXI08_16735, partial [bacterium]|nr:hypothetical protein [bacterium]